MFEIIVYAMLFISFFSMLANAIWLFNFVQKQSLSNANNRIKFDKQEILYEQIQQDLQSVKHSLSKIDHRLSDIEKWRRNRE